MHITKPLIKSLFLSLEIEFSLAKLKPHNSFSISGIICLSLDIFGLVVRLLLPVLDQLFLTSEVIDNCVDRFDYSRFLFLFGMSTDEYSVWMESNSIVIASGFVFIAKIVDGGLVQYDFFGSELVFHDTMIFK